MEKLLRINFYEDVSNQWVNVILTKGKLYLSPLYLLRLFSVTFLFLFRNLFLLLQEFFFNVIFHREIAIGNSYREDRFAMIAG